MVDIPGLFMVDGGWWRMILEYLTHGLDLVDSIHELWDEPAPDFRSGRA